MDGDRSGEMHQRTRYSPDGAHLHYSLTRSTASPIPYDLPCLRCSRYQGVDFSAEPLGKGVLGEAIRGNDKDQLSSEHVKMIIQVPTLIFSGQLKTRQSPNSSLTPSPF
jgi:hypothetical protein